ncbi:hypothetical protein [Aquimarina mytili]|uniref:Uncharacterized protein n=1 Tax=Aquimarina mytili TaxID=874423 RepID=A0A937DB76_9FLAO|nr:hypothetical protein [Aquimarina mytili]MBL0684313.1 hypothetical protein [Aquimarina mytili]
MTDNPDYNSLLKAELVELLGKRDTEIAKLKEINTTQATDIAKQVASITQLKKDLFECRNAATTADGIIEAVLDLPEDQVQALPVLLRTTDKGIEAFTAFNYGALSCVGATDGSGSSTDNPDNPDNPDTPFPCEGHIPTL